MVNVVWLVLIVAGVIVGGAQGRIEAVTQAAVTAAETAVSLAIKLIGVMALWLGIMKIAEKAGIIMFFTQLIRPLTAFLFPSVPRNHPAMGAIMMTLSANMLGLGNAVTPLGLKAMQELQTLNPDKETASEAMCTLLALCTASFTLVPATMIALRAAAGSANPAAIVSATLLASSATTLAVIVADKICRMIFGRRQKGGR